MKQQNRFGKNDKKTKMKKFLYQSEENKFKSHKL